MNIPLLFLLLLTLTRSFYIYLNDQAPQCFYTHIYKDQQLLIEVQTTLVSVTHKIILQVKNNDQIVLDKELVNLVKFTVPRQTHQIRDNEGNHEFDYQTCFKIQKQANIQTQGSNSQTNSSQVELRIPKGYFLSIKLMTNFSHSLENNVQRVQSANVDYKQIEKLSQRLLQLNSEQINLHQIHSMKQKLTQSYLQVLKEKIIIYSMIEIIMIIAFTSVQIQLLKGYISDISII